MKSKIDFKIYSVDGKFYEDQVDAIYLNVPSSGVIGILPNRTPYTAMLHIGIFYIVKDNVKTSFAISGGTFNFKKNVAVLLALTYEKEDELDKEKIIKSRDEALKKLSTIDKNDTLDYENATFDLKKAINRLKILK